MDVIKHLLQFLFKFAVLMFFVAFLWWGVATFVPAFGISSLLHRTSTSTESSSWLPSPRNYQGLFGKAETPNEYSNVYVPGQMFNGYTNAYRGNEGGANVDFVTYTSTGTQIIRGNQSAVFNNQEQFSQSQTNTQIQNGNVQNNLFVRNISIYQGGHVYTGLSFVGEARESMFLNGKFPIVIVDQGGKIVSVSYAMATTNWTIPGWVKFQVKIVGSLPNKTPCTMVFEQARIQNSQVVPVRVRLPVVCN